MFAFNIMLSLSCFLHSEKSCLLSAGAEDQLNTKQPSPYPSYQHTQWSLVIMHNYMVAYIKCCYIAWQHVLTVRNLEHKTLSYFSYILKSSIFFLEQNVFLAQVNLANELYENIIK